MGAQNTVELGDVLEIAKAPRASDGQLECRLSCLSPLGQGLTLVLSAQTAKKLHLLLHHSLSAKD